MNSETLDCPEERTSGIENKADWALGGVVNSLRNRAGEIRAHANAVNSLEHQIRLLDESNLQLAQMVSYNYNVLSRVNAEAKILERELEDSAASIMQTVLDNRKDIQAYADLIYKATQMTASSLRSREERFNEMLEEVFNQKTKLRKMEYDEMIVNTGSSASEQGDPLNSTRKLAKKIDEALAASKLVIAPHSFEQQPGILCRAFGFEPEVHPHVDAPNS